MYIYKDQTDTTSIRTTLSKSFIYTKLLKLAAKIIAKIKIQKKKVNRVKKNDQCCYDEISKS